MADNIFGTLGALLSINDGVTTPSTPFGAPPMAGVGGATNAFQQAQGLAPAIQPVPQIYAGKGQDEVRTGHPSSGTTTETIKFDLTDDPDDLFDKFVKTGPKEKRRMALLLSLAGYAGEGSFEKLIVESLDMTLGDTIEAYKALLTDAVTQYSVNGNKVTVDQLLRRGIAYKMPASANWDGDLSTVGDALSNLGVKIAGVTDGSGDIVDEEGDTGSSVDGIARKDKPFTGTKTTTSTSTVRDVMDPADAKALTRAMLQRELGRDPTSEEFADFIGAVQYAQKVNPSVSKTKQSYTYEKDELVSQSSNTTTRSGIGSDGIADIALQKARQNPNWAEWQAVGTYAPALFEALGATVAGR